MRRWVMQKRYGHLIILDELIQNGYKKYHCLCDCGQETIVYHSNLVSGRTKSCGCGNVKNRHRYKDLSNKKFGELVALTPTEERSEGTVVWKCLCSCGNEIMASAKRLQRGEIRSCGCLKEKKFHIETQIFGNLTVIEPLNKKLDWKTKWRCKCSCGQLCEVSYGNLSSGHTKSCGCLKRVESRTCVKGTIVECLKAKLAKNNTSGVKGVYRCKRMWVAYITFRGKRHYLGTYDNLSEAALARKKAEDKYFLPLLKQFSS